MSLSMAVKIKNRHRLKERDVRELLSDLQNRFQGTFFDGKASVDVGTLEEFTVFLVNDSIDFMRYHDSVILTLQGVNNYQLQNKFVVVDMGAVSFITKGADVMGPGITDADEKIQKDDVVWICDEKHHKPLAVGIALITGEEMRMKKPGKAVKTLHYVGDRLWVLSHE
jgi:PUA domain protein